MMAATDVQHQLSLSIDEVYNFLHITCDPENSGKEAV